MKRIPISDLRKSDHWHEAFRVGRLIDGVTVEVPDDFPLSASIPIPAASPAMASIFFSRPADPAAQAARLAICAACPSNVGGKCAKCPICGGRPVTAKVMRADESCPEGKWGKLTGG